MAMKGLYLIFVLLAVFIGESRSHANIYGYQDNNGTFHFTNIPPAHKKYRTIVYTGRQTGSSPGISRSGQRWGHDRNDIIGFAKTYLGSPYKLGGNLTSGIDCSGFVKQVYSEFDITLPRTAREQFLEGTKVDRNSLVAGDLIFFRSEKSNDPAHVGIFIDDDKFIHATTRNGGGVRIDSLADRYYQRTFMGASRVMQ
jgi:cell wall-associated NlpC family hydrolase